MFPIWQTITILTTIFYLSTQASAEKKEISGAVSFLAEASPGFLEIEGSGASFKGSLEKAADGLYRGVFVCDLSQFETGIELRDNHLKEKYLEVDLYPRATLKLEPTKLPPSGGSLKFKGLLTWRGVSKMVEGQVKRQEKLLTATFKVNTLDFNMPKASYKLVKVGEVVHVTVTFMD